MAYGAFGSFYGVLSSADGRNFGTEFILCAHSTTGLYCYFVLLPLEYEKSLNFLWNRKPVVVDRRKGLHFNSVTQSNNISINKIGCYGKHAGEGAEVAIRVIAKFCGEPLSPAPAVNAASHSRMNIFLM